MNDGSEGSTGPSVGMGVVEVGIGSFSSGGGVVAPGVCRVGVGGSDGESVIAPSQLLFNLA
jgi:hypothetical protein